MLCERDTMGFRDRLSDLREDIEFKGNERQSGKTVEKLCKVLSGSDFAMNMMHLEMNTEKTDALFLLNHNGHAVYGWIMCIYPFKDEVKEDPNAEPKFLIQAQMELREDATWPNDADFTIRDANGRFAGEREAGFERNSSVFYNTEFRGKKVTYAKMCSKTFRVKKTYPASIMDSPAEAEKAMRDFVALLGRSVIQFSPQIESMLVRNQSGTSRGDMTAMEGCYPDCPRCRRRMHAADMKANGNVDGEDVEWYVCPGCGKRFRIASSAC